MSLFISSLNSGSNGNCYYVGNQHEAVLIDAGLSCRETERRMLRSGLNIEKVKAIFITHEHSDHMKGVEFIARKHKVPVYISEETYKSSRLNIDKNLLKHFEAYSPVTIGGLKVNAFPKNHDASDPHSFTVSGNGIAVGILTDIGSACDHVVKNFSSCNAAFLEANYDEEMLENGTYPYYLKKRIKSDHGHLSNRQALDLFSSHRPDFMSLLLLSHLSKDNNDPGLVHDLFRRHSGNTHVAIASRYRESQVYCVTGDKINIQEAKNRGKSTYSIQMTLFPDISVTTI